MNKTLSRILILLIIMTIVPTEALKVKAANLTGIIFSKNIDVNNDLKVDIKDLAQVSKSYDTNNKTTGWQVSYDFNNDGSIDIYDLTLVSRFIDSLITIEDINDFAEIGQKYALPSFVKAHLGDKNFVMLPVSWNTTAVNTAAAGKYTYTGTVTGYNKAIALTLNIAALNKDANINNYGYVAFDGAYVYYSNPVNGGKLSKANVDGSGVTKINDDQALFINVINGWIYYCNFSDNGAVYKVKTDGTGRIKLTTDKAQYLYVYNNKLYYLNENDGYKLYSMNIDGTNRTAFIQDMPLFINFYNQYIYYSNFSNYGEVTRVNLDGTSKTPINDEASMYVNTIGNYIYYQNYYDKFMYKMNIDGTNKTLLRGENSAELNVVGEWIYYINETDNNTIHRIKIDGTRDEQLLSTHVTDINITGGRIFLYGENGYLYSIKLDGTDLKLFGICTTIKSIENVNELSGQGDSYKLPNRVIATMTDGSRLLVPVTWNSYSIDTSTLGTYTFKGYVVGYDSMISLTVNVVERGSTNENNVIGGRKIEKNGWIYFNDDIDGKLYKIKENGTAKTKICDDEPYNINIVGDWIYYTNTSGIYKISTGGTGRTNLTSENARQLSVLGEWIFYVNGSDNNYLYKIKTDGTSKTRLNAEFTSNINISGNWIYYINTQDTYSINRVSIDGSIINKLGYSGGSAMIVYEDKIILGETMLDLDGQYLSRIISFGRCLSFNVKGDRLYYTTRAYTDEAQLYTIKLDGTDNKLLVSDKLEDRYSVGGDLRIYLFNDWIYYSNYSDGRTYRVKSDGTNRQIFGYDMTLKSVGDFNVSLLLGESYKLSSQIPANTVGGIKTYVPVTWNTNVVDSSKLGTTYYEGIVAGYDKKIKLTISVVDKEVSGNTSGNLSNGAFIAQSSNWIIFNNYIMQSNGSNKTQYTQDWVNDLNCIGDWVYYSSKFIYKVKLDGTGKEIICNDAAANIRIVGDWIYYTNLSDFSKLYKIRTSGLDRTKVSDDNVYNMAVYKGWIYYRNDSDNCKLYKIKNDGTGRMKLSDENPRSINVIDGWIYYQSDLTTVHKIKLDGTYKTLVANVTQWTNVNVSGDSIYVEKNYHLYRIKLDGSSETILDIQQPTNINILGDWVYYRASDGYFYKIKIDGTGKQLI